MVGWNLNLGLGDPKPFHDSMAMFVRALTNTRVVREDEGRDVIGGNDREEEKKD